MELYSRFDKIKEDWIRLKLKYRISKEVYILQIYA